MFMYHQFWRIEMKHRWYPSGLPLCKWRNPGGYVFNQLLINHNKTPQNDGVLSWLTFKQLEMNGCLISTIATDALVLKHWAISIHGVGYILIVLDQFHKEILHLYIYVTL